MRINVLMCSRGDSVSYQTTVCALQELESGENEVRYICGVDPDDVETGVMLNNVFSHNRQCVISIGDRRPLTLGEVQNRLAKVDCCYGGKNGVPVYEPADVYFPLGDHMMCLTQDWDVHLDVCMSGSEVGSWVTSYNPNDCLAPVMSRDWVESLGYVAFDLFPYWFTDTWTQEVYEMATGEKVPLFQELVFGGKRGTTQSLREIDFWWGVFNATRTIRFRHAAKVRDDLGMEITGDLKRRMKDMVERDRLMRTRFMDMEKNNPAKPPDARYIEAKANAERYLSDHDLGLWCNENGFIE